MFRNHSSDPTLTWNPCGPKSVLKASYQRKSTTMMEAYRKYLWMLFQTKSARSPLYPSAAFLPAQKRSFCCTSVRHAGGVQNKDRDRDAGGYEEAAADAGGVHHT